MTDITELAQSLKAAAEKATPGEWRRASTQFNGITATPFMLGRKEVMIAGVSEKRDAEFIALANPANILALVEALEKAQQLATQQGNIACALFDEVTAQRQRIAELESRTVKLPKLKMLEDYLAEVAIEERKQILVGVKLEFHRALAAAGIKVEDE
ncbi:ead/Ea22-like family protein [Klebsiella pneumoniae]|uniref:ead/Ea22-like family protein n=1 Tax=Klebsiella pneumoniae TaxID=573 RepID=UPI000A26A430|nr:ead/Ea22-like family protein [Klebsiella pneumoniae]EIX9650059.1 ead/Ea22-like family protein [Klebsiella pneumoniae]EKZ1431205.1 ead/Ea22-like family protein [Klebsiella pneumoniae]HBR3720225.1 ead/Ea22-like family protein [Klebsiella pneumoniae]HBR4006121.1 ead/Ea22-like family protein [Klebsiella pneumoniae]HCI8094929.1 ead/Ea22-like family protein [Klebsiella pneumoniae]